MWVLKAGCYVACSAAGALLKAAFICAEVVEVFSHLSLADQLMTKYGCGFRLKTVSNIPQGSGER